MYAELPRINPNYKVQPPRLTIREDILCLTALPTGLGLGLIRRLSTLVSSSEPVKGTHKTVRSDLQFRESQFTYAVSAVLPTSYGNALSKLDAKNGSSQQWHEPGCITTEPLMIPRPGATAEVSTCPPQAPCHPAECFVKPLHAIASL